MARIPLRAYNQEIEGLIESHQIDQAIAHCQHILRYYPKHIDTYRLLGKSFLESRRYGDAADIFQRVLSSVPDDFVSHVGMSIIREDEGNLDEAIWYMERAFDVQPANSAIQRELSRLYGGRDGLEPPKIRLTRGALARMYFKGELYPQAINEIRSILTHSPQRFDLLVLLAQANFRAGQRFEAAEVCSTILKALPFCLEANYILGEILANSERAPEAKTFHLRAQALNPYLAHVTPNAPAADKVSDSAVVIEKMIWTPGKAPQQPAWAASLGVDMEDTSPKEEALPEWLADTEEASTEPQQGKYVSSPTSPLDEDFTMEAPSQSLSEGELPEWMQEAGWEPGSGAADEMESYLAEEDSDLPEEEIAPADMPDWLQEVAPDKAQEESDFLAEEKITPDFGSPKPRSTGSLPWIDDAPSSESDSVATWLQDKKVPVTGDLQGEQSEESVELPEWLQGMEEIPDQEDFSQVLLNIDENLTPQADVLPTGFQPLNAEHGAAPELHGRGTDEPSDLDGDEGLAWLEGLTEKQGEVAAVSDSASAMEPTTDSPLTPEEEEAFAWLEGLAEKQGAGGAIFSQPEDRPEETPQWVQDAVSQADLESIDLEEVAGVQTEAEIIDSAPDAEKTTAASMHDEWLIEEEVEIAAVDLPDWRQETEIVKPEVIDQLSDDTIPPLPEWLKSEYVEPTLETKRIEDLPEWLEPAPIETETETSEKLVPVDATIHEDDQPEAVKVDFEMLFGPGELQRPAEQVEPLEQLIIEETPIIEGDTAPTGIRSEEDATSAFESEEFYAGEDIPEWLEGLEEEADLVNQLGIGEELQSQPETEISTDEDAAFAWLEGLAAKQGTDEALLLHPEERTEEPPDWVIQAAEEEIGTAISDSQAEVIQASTELVPEAVDYQQADQIDQIEAEFELADEAEARETAFEDTLQIEPDLAEKVEKVVEGLIEPGEPVQELPAWLAGLEQESELRDEPIWQPTEETFFEELPTQEGEPAVEKPLLNINEAGLVDFEQLPGIGFIKAQAILEYRKEHGDFDNIDELQNVAGLGPSIIDSIRSLITVGIPVELEALEPLSEHQITLMKARNAFVSGEISQTVALYEQLVKSERLLPEVINDLNEALYRFPVEVSLWESLGDAYFRADKLQDALDAYTKAEELLR